MSGLYEAFVAGALAPDFWIGVAGHFVSEASSNAVCRGIRMFGIAMVVFFGTLQDREMFGRSDTARLKPLKKTKGKKGGKIRNPGSQRAGKRPLGMRKRKAKGRRSNK